MGPDADCRQLVSGAGPLDPHTRVLCDVTGVGVKEKHGEFSFQVSLI